MLSGVSPFAVTARAASAVAAVASYAAWPSLIGAEMVQNGDCSSGTGWTLPAGFAIAAGKMTLTATNNTASNAGVVDTALIEGATYRCAETADVATSGSYQIFVGATAGAARSTAASFTQDLVATDLASGDGWFIDATSATFQLDNFSVKSVGLLGVEADWAFVGEIAWTEGPPTTLSFGEADQSSTASLTGAALTSFTAAVSLNTACLIRVYVTEYNGGDIAVRVHTGSWVALNVSGTGWSTPVAITSGAVAGFSFRGDAGGTAFMLVAAVDIDLA